MYMGLLPYSASNDDNKVTNLDLGVAEKVIHQINADIDIYKCGFKSLSIPIAPEFIDNIKSQFKSAADAAAHYAYDVADEFMSALDLCVSLNCKNISTIINPASVSLNNKRKRNGKLPLFDYKVLVINHVGKDKGISENINMDRHSPRRHFRRGHIRRLNKTRPDIIWVSATIVGKETDGFIGKEYLLLSFGFAMLGALLRQ